MSKIHVHENRAYIVISFGGLLIVYVSDPTAPKISGLFSTSSHF